MNREPKTVNRKSSEKREWRGYAHERLDVYRLARTLVADVYREAARFPDSEHFGLTPQTRRASVSIPMNIAEGAARGSKREFARFLQIARGSTTELKVLLEIALEIGALPAARFEVLERAVERIFAMTSGLLRMKQRTAGEAP